MLKPENHYYLILIWENFYSYKWKDVRNCTFLEMKPELFTARSRDRIESHIVIIFNYIL